LADYTALKTAYTATLDAYLLMEAEAMLVDGGELSDEMLTISATLNIIEDWITAKEEGTLLEEFLVAQKALMVEYGMVIDVVSIGEVGYGTSYGSGDAGIKFSVSKDGLTAEKVFDTISVSESDL
jgi:hypothetical protein